VLCLIYKHKPKQSLFAALFVSARQTQINSSKVKMDIASESEARMLISIQKHKKYCIVLLPYYHTIAC